MSLAVYALCPLTLLLLLLLKNVDLCSRLFRKILKNLQTPPSFLNIGLNQMVEMPLDGKST